MRKRYPAELEQAGLLRDGRSVLIRPVRAADEEAMLDFSRRLSRRTLAQRLLGPVPRFQRELLRQFVDVDYTDHLALVAFLDDRMIGVGRLIRLEDTDHAEVTFTIADEFQGMGLGRLLLDRLAAAAPAIGVYVFEADVLATNTAMLQVFATSGYSPSITPEGYLQHVVLRVDKRASALARISRREHRAARRSLEKLLAPRAVAVIGANRQPGTIGHEILVNLIAHGFPGPVYPVNPAAADIAGRPAVARVQDLPQPVDLAVIAVPPAAFADVIRDCAEARVGAIVVVTADYPGEADTRHTAERDITRFVRSHGMRMVGPTSMGLLSTHAGSVLHATFAPVRPPAGPVAMSSQSGPLGLAILDLAHRTGLGFSCFVSIGAAADVSSNDLLEWWEDDPETGVVLLYLESFGNPRNFGRIARRVGARKPVVAVTPGSAVASAALLAQAGVIHTTSLEDMFDVATVLANQPVPPGSRVAIVTNAIDPARLAVAACAASGLTMAALSAPTLDRLLAAGIAPPLAARAPGVVDLRPTAAPGDYLATLSAVLADPKVDSAIVIFMPPLVRAVAEVAAAIKQAASDAGGKPVVASFMSESGLPALLRDDHGAIPSYVFPERAAAALGRAAAYGRWRREPVGALVYPPGIDQKAAGELVAAADTGWLAPADAAALLGHYGIRVADAVPPADQGPGDTATPRRDEEARRGVLRVHQDSLVGPVISFGLAGLFSDLFGDVATGVTPLTDRDASALLASLRAYPLLTGAAGGSPADLPAIEETMLRLSALAEDWPAIAEVTIDTLLIGAAGEGVTAVAPAVRIAPAREVSEPGS
jgi:acyl-CoA synthetase (NDP forming)/RimJ/RimL family protein N-acetyltransferase